MVFEKIQGYQKRKRCAECGQLMKVANQNRQYCDICRIKLGIRVARA